MIGYPLALNLDTMQIDFDYPLVKRGIIAGINNKNNSIVVDCTIHKGNSGSPVFTISGTSMKLIGVASQFVPYFNVKNEKGKVVASSIGNSGYGIVRSIDFVSKLIDSFD